MPTALFIAWGIFATWRRGRDLAVTQVRYSLRQKLEVVLPKVVPFLLIIVGVLYVLYGGIATPSEAAGVGALLCLVLVMAVYRLWRDADLWQIFRATLQIGDDHDDHRGGRPVQLHDVDPVHHPGARDADRRRSRSTAGW